MPAADPPDLNRPRLLVNQVGYLPGCPTTATLVTEASDPVPWRLQRDCVLVAEGMSVPRGLDSSAGVAVFPTRTS